MSRQSGGGGDLARGAGAAAVKGALLIGLAVIIGVFLLQRADTTSKAGSPTPTVKHSTTSTTVHKSTSSSTSSSTLPASPQKKPDELRVIVLNGGAPTGAAAALRTQLQQEGYTNQPQANTWTGHSQTGDTLMCKPGFDREKVALSQQTALQSAKVVDFANPPPPFSSDVDCVVVVGA